MARGARTLVGICSRAWLPDIGGLGARQSGDAARLPATARQQGPGMPAAGCCCEQAHAWWGVQACAAAVQRMERCSGEPH
jgi:hypothetical protein